MTFLYIKQHNKTGLKYFGKTTEDDPVAYPGSGTYWKDHLLVHGNDVITTWYKKFDDVTALTEYAINFSMNNNIVEATDNTGKKIWANLVNENGIDGFPKGGKMPPRSQQHLANWSASRIGHDVSDKTRELQSKSKEGKTYEEIYGTNAADLRKKRQAQMAGANNNNALVWEITAPDGTVTKVKGLRTYCKENNLSFSSIYNSKSGWKSVKYGAGNGGGRKRKNNA